MSSKHIVCPSCHGVNRVPVERLGDGPKCGRCQQVLLAGTPLELGQSSFRQHVVNCSLPILVDFWAPWCGPCKMMAPVFAEAARELSPEVRLVKVNTEVEQALAGQYNIRSIPTLALFKDGQEVDRIAGAMDKQNLMAWVRQRI
ncbi:MAG: thioredoxin TrxC [Gammaproteobacteria bacterium]|nr:MAG: thioredoxin TrxC [Gammaproteobacteria bacterium]